MTPPKNLSPTNPRPNACRIKEITARALADLSPEERFLFLGREIERLSFKEIAHITGKNVDGVRRHFLLLKKRLRARLRPFVFDAPPGSVH